MDTGVICVAVIQSPHPVCSTPDRGDRLGDWVTIKGLAACSQGFIKVTSWNLLLTSLDSALKSSTREQIKIFYYTCWISYLQD